MKSKDFFTVHIPVLGYYTNSEDPCRRRKTRRLHRVVTVYLEACSMQNTIKISPSTRTPKTRNELIQMIRMGERGEKKDIDSKNAIKLRVRPILFSTKTS